MYQTKGDHRAIVLDLDTNILFGRQHYNLKKHNEQEFTSKDKNSNRYYIEYKHHYLTSHNFPQGLHQLTQHWSPQQAEALD